MTLQDTLAKGEAVVVVFAHGGEYDQQRFESDHDVDVSFYTKPRQCMYANQLAGVVTRLRKGDIPENAGGRDTKLKVDSSSIANTSFTFHDDSGAVESIVGLQYGVYLLKSTGLARCLVNLTRMTNMWQIHEHAVSLGIHHILQLSCSPAGPAAPAVVGAPSSSRSPGPAGPSLSGKKAKCDLAQLTGRCTGCSKGAIPLSVARSPINVLLDMQCGNCSGSVMPSALEVYGVSWGMDLTVLDAPSGSLKQRHVPMQKSTGTVRRPQRHELQVTPGVSLFPNDVFRQLVITLST